MHASARNGTYGLVVDDEVAFARSVALALEARYALPIVALASGEAALAYCEARLPQWAVLDVQMYVLDGLALARQLRVWAPELPIVFVTASAADLDLAGLTARGEPVGLVSKPASVHRIFDALDEVLGQGRPTP